MMPASSTMNGSCMGMPNVCKVPAPPAPPIPVPFPSIAQCAMATSTSTKVMIMNMPAIVLNTQIPQSSGDEAGVAGGVISGMNMGPAIYKMGSSKVKFEGKSACMLTSTTSHNGSNPNFPAGAQIAPSQAKVLIGM